MKVDEDISIILGRPFLFTTRALIAVQMGELTLRMHDQILTLNVFKSMQYPNVSNYIHQFFHIDVLGNIVENMLMDYNYDHHLGMLC